MTDFLGFGDLLSPAEQEILARVREFLRSEVDPIANEYWARAEFPFQLIDGFRKLDIAGLMYDGLTADRGTRLLAGFLSLEIARADPSINSFYGVHTGLAMGSIDRCGSAEQRQRWLPPMARLEQIGAFGLTEPHGGSDVAGGLETTARRDGDRWVLNGAKKWIGNGTFADLVVVWARDEADGEVKGFVVEKGTPGFTATKIESKIALRTVQNADIMLTECGVSPERPAAERELVPGHRGDAAPDPWRRGVAGGGIHDGGLRDRAAVRHRAHAVRPPDRRIPDGPGPAGDDARQRHLRPR